LRPRSGTPEPRGQPSRGTRKGDKLDGQEARVTTLEVAIKPGNKRLFTRQAGALTSWRRIAA
jgi:hypothetical protein